VASNQAQPAKLLLIVKCCSCTEILTKSIRQNGRNGHFGQPESAERTTVERRWRRGGKGKNDRRWQEMEAATIRCLLASS